MDQNIGNRYENIMLKTPITPNHFMITFGYNVLPYFFHQSLFFILPNTFDVWQVSKNIYETTKEQILKKKTHLWE